MAKYIFIWFKNNMKINPVFTNVFIKPNRNAQFKPNFTSFVADSTSFNVIKDYLEANKVAEVKLYDKNLKKYVQADLTDDGKEFKIFKDKKELGSVRYSIEAACTTPSIYADTNYHPYAKQVTRMRELEARGSNVYKGVGSTLVKACIQKSLSNSTQGKVTLLAWNVYNDIVPHMSDISPIPFYSKLGFEPTSNQIKKDLETYSVQLGLYKKGILPQAPKYQGEDHIQMYLSGDKIKQYKQELQKNPIYKA